MEKTRNLCLHMCFALQYAHIPQHKHKLQAASSPAINLHCFQNHQWYVHTSMMIAWKSLITPFLYHSI